MPKNDDVLAKVKSDYSRPPLGNQINGFTLRYLGNLLARWGRNPNRVPKVEATLKITELPVQVTVDNAPRMVYPDSYTREVGIPFIVKMTYLMGELSYRLIFAPSPGVALQMCRSNESLVGVEIVDAPVFYVDPDSEGEDIV